MSKEETAVGKLKYRIVFQHFVWFVACKYWLATKGHITHFYVFFAVEKQPRKKDKYRKDKRKFKNVQNSYTRLTKPLIMIFPNNIF